MRWHQIALLLALTGCSAGQNCTLVGCASLLTVTLPAGTTEAQACVDGVCADTVQDGALMVPLSRKSEGVRAQVTVTIAGTAYEGTVPVTRTMPNGKDCGPICVNGNATVDLAGGTVVPG